MMSKDQNLPESITPDAPMVLNPNQDLNEGDAVQNNAHMQE